jgi:DNA mismatch repair protein MutS
MEEKSLSPTMQQYVAIKKQHPDSLLFYRLGDFFELFFDDAVTASRELDIALTTRGKQGGQDVPMCGVPVHAYELYLAKLIQKGYRVVVCDQIETPEEAKLRGAKGPLARSITRIVTGGTLTEEGMLSGDNNYIVAIYVMGKNAAVAIADISTGFFGLEETTIDNIDDVIARWAPSEIILSDDIFAKLQAVLEPWKKKLTVVPDAKYKSLNAKYLLTSVYNVQTLDIFGDIPDHELQAAGVLVDYVVSTQCCKNLSLSAPKLIHSKEFLSIDMATRRNLELTSSVSGEKSNSLLAVINNTETAAGRRLLHAWIAAPLLDVRKIEERLSDIEYFVGNTHLRTRIRDSLRGLPDIERILSRLALNRMNPRDVGALRVALERYKAIKLLCAKSDKFLRTAPDFTDMLAELCKAFKEELPSQARDGNFVAEGFDEQLDEFRNLRTHVSDNLLQLQTQYIQQTGIHNLRIKRNNVWGIYIEISASQIFRVPFDFVHRQTLTNCTRYTTSELIALEKRIEQAETSYINKEIEIFEQFIAKILAVRDPLSVVSKELAYLDVVSSSAELAITNKYVRPQFSTKPELCIVAGRHPVVEQSFKNKEEYFAPNDCNLNHDSRRFLLVTGPNMAGKSTYLRQNALIVIMAQMGLFVPADSALIGIVDKIFSRIGASDDLASGRSTFMVEMIETAAILHQATDRSLVILDEIGRGTATYDGLSIAWSVSEYLYLTVQCRTLFATHYHELTKLSEAFDGVVPVTAATHEWENKIVFQHKIVDGCAQKSYGIHVAQLAGLPKNVILRATELLHAFETEVNVKPKTEKVIRQHINKLQKELF